jgi:hypothetical protein
MDRNFLRMMTEKDPPLRSRPFTALPLPLNDHSHHELLFGLDLNSYFDLDLLFD